RLVGLTGGTLTMGTPETDVFHQRDEPQRRVALSRFAICETEVSVRQYEIVVGTRPADCDEGCEREHPVQRVSWYDAARFMNALTRRENAVAGSERALTLCYDEATWAWDFACTGYRLPSEAEWEFAARAGTTTAYHFGDDPREICKFGNVRTAGCEDGFRRLAPVASHSILPNAWGLHGMVGNVCEWTFDWYGDYDAIATRTNPVSTTPSTYRVLRGGSYYFGDGGAQSGRRHMFPPDTATALYGFRCARGAIGASATEAAQ
ncbi:MAG: formylglycine-generating enzyme family protein, partial [Deltaproteobacteria bacterium]|nr:formylglycine-generating enzyme family protein [Deltaproteobacteria bacterium]